MERFRFTVIGAVLAFLLALSSWVFQLNVFEKIMEALHSVEKYDVDEIIIPGLILFFFMYLDQVRMAKKRKMESERVKIYKAMLRSSHHILNNFLNQMQIFKIKAEDTPGFDVEVLSLYDDISAEASTLIDALGNLSSIDEKSIADAMSPK